MPICYNRVTSLLSDIFVTFDVRVYRYGGKNYITREDITKVLDYAVDHGYTIISMYIEYKGKYCKIPLIYRRIPLQVTFQPGRYTLLVVYRQLDSFPETSPKLYGLSPCEARLVVFHDVFVLYRDNKPIYPIRLFRRLQETSRRKAVGLFIKLGNRYYRIQETTRDIPIPVKAGIYDFLVIYQRKFPVYALQCSLQKDVELIGSFPVTKSKQSGLRFAIVPLQKQYSKFYIKYKNMYCLVKRVIRLNERTVCLVLPQYIAPGKYSIYGTIRKITYWLELACTVNYREGKQAPETLIIYSWVKVRVPEGQTIQQFVEENMLQLKEYGEKYVCCRAETFPIALPPIEEPIIAVTGLYKTNREMMREFHQIKDRFPIEPDTPEDIALALFIKKINIDSDEEVPTSQAEIKQGKPYYYHGAGKECYIIWESNGYKQPDHYPRCKNLFVKMVDIDDENNVNDALKALSGYVTATFQSSPGHYHLWVNPETPNSLIQQFDDPKHFFFSELTDRSYIRISSKGSKPPPRRTTKKFSDLLPP